MPACGHGVLTFADMWIPARHLWLEAVGIVPIESRAYSRRRIGDYRFMPGAHFLNSVTILALFDFIDLYDAWIWPRCVDFLPGLGGAETFGKDIHTASDDALGNRTRRVPLYIRGPKKASESVHGAMMRMGGRLSIKLAGPRCGPAHD